MIDHGILESSFAAAKTTWDGADPFPYCSIDGMIAPKQARQMAADFPGAVTRSGRDTTLQKHLDVNRKVGISDLSIMSEAQQSYFAAVQTSDFLRYLERLTGISPLFADPDLVGGGLHAIYRGGFLNVHADFNFHPKTGTLRCLNLITYLNDDWEPSWNGQLELWPEDLDKDPVLIEPVMNRTALFRTSETSWHGHPKPLACPPEACRRSVAVYYYTDWPEGLEQRAKTRYVLTPWQRRALTAELDAVFDSLKTKQDAIAAAPGFTPRHVVEIYNELKAQRAN